MYRKKPMNRAESPHAADWFVAWRGPEQAARAAGELAQYLSRVLGVTVPTGEQAPAEAACVFVVTDSRHAPSEIAEKFQGTRLDAFAVHYPVEWEGRKVCLLVSHDAHACDYPVYYFLRRYLDVEWLGPGEIGLVLREQPDWRMPAAIRDFENPDYEHRYWRTPRMPTRAWLAGNFRLQFHHNLGTVFDPEQYSDQPDLYPYYEGRRHLPDIADAKARWGPDWRFGPWEPCTSNPKAVEIAVEYGLKHLHEHPEQKSFSLSVNDGSDGYCMCDDCRAQDAQGALDAGWIHLTDRFLRFYNTVIERVLEQNPEAYLAALSYNRCKFPPSEVKAHPRILAFSVCDNSNPVPDLAERQRLWQAAGAQPCLYQWLYDSGFLTVRHYPHAQRDIIALSHSLGGFGYYTEAHFVFVAGGPKLYAVAHALWNTKADVDALLDRYFRLAYGPGAGPAVRAYFDRWEQVWERGGEAIRYNTLRDWRSVSQLDDLTRDDLVAIDAAMKAARAAPADQAQQQRLALLQTYHQWLRLNLDQYLVSRELADEAWLGARSPEEVLDEAERGMALTPEFERLWREDIATDRTGWLLQERYHDDPGKAWEALIQPIRDSVIAGYEPALDIACGRLTQRMFASRTKEEVAAYWVRQAEQRPNLALWARTQVHLLDHGPGANIAPNPDFARGKPGSPPQIEGWSLEGSYQGMPSEFGWEANGGREGSAAAMMGWGYAARIKAQLPTRAGHRYRLSVGYKTSGPNNRFSAGVPGGGLRTPPTQDVWREATTTFTAREDGTPLNLRTSIQSRGEWTWIDSVELVEICRA